MQITSKYQFYKYAAMSSFAVFLLGGALMLQPLSFTDNSYADSSNTDISINIGETIMLPELSQEAINLNLEPNVDGDFTSASIDVRMSTNHVSGYTLTMSTEGVETALTSSDFDSYKIDALNSKTSATDFANLSSTASINKWGYATDNNGDGEGQTEENYYYGITNKDNPTTIKITDGPTNSSETNVTFATKGKDLAAGTYSNVVVFSAVGNYVPIPVTNETYLQDITAADCAATPVYDPNNPDATTFTVKDKRDNQEYRIRRLYMTAEHVDSPTTTACWMVDNLKVTKTTIEAAGNSAKLSSNTSNVADNSEFELTASDDSEWCADDTDTCKNQSMLIDTDYGTLYNWYAATAGTGTYNTTGIATASICPGKGVTVSNTWHLPTGNTSNEWYQLFQAYQSAYGWTTVSGQSSSGTMANTWSTTIGPDFVYSGCRRGGNTLGQFSAGYGNWWSSMANDNNNAYSANLDYNYRYVNGGTDSNNKYNGRAVRCVLPASS